MSAYVAGCPESSRHLRETRCVLWVFYTGLVALSPDSGYAYDVCLSYAGEQRAYVELVAAGLRRAGVRVFFDAYEQATLWGKDLYEHLSHIYQEAAQYCVLFASAEYAAKVWTSHERRNAQARALNANEEYILPARFDDTKIPGLSPTVAYIDLRGIAPEDLVGLILEKLRPHDGEERLLTIALPVVPRSSSEQMRLLSEKPPAWEYILFASELQMGQRALLDKWHDHELGYAARSGKHIDPESAPSYLEAKFSEIQEIISAIELIFSCSAQNRAFGEPGQAGDEERIKHLARKLLHIYEGLLDWSAHLRSLSVPSEFTRAFRLAASFSDQPLREIRQFIESFIAMAEQLPEMLAQGQPVRVSMDLIVTADDLVIEEFNGELRRLGEVLG
ncbi:toll/interleukin-1 receptor domain-containing protein [Nonomuraea salmonea]|uniref:Toll/interleukin-1 receptor domain-containing protein n=1 Tax=Nonomuraea salmonea TaxID=46181 RepID=A0ABV5NX84_9ACTN